MISFLPAKLLRQSGLLAASALLALTVSTASAANTYLTQLQNKLNLHDPAGDTVATAEISDLEIAFQAVLTGTAKGSANLYLSAALLVRPPASLDSDAVALVPAVITYAGGAAPNLATISKITAVVFTGSNAVTSGTGISSVINSVKDLAPLSTGSNKRAFTNSLIGGLLNPNSISGIVQDVFSTGTSGLTGTTTPAAFSLAVAKSMKANAIRAAASINGGLALLATDPSAQLALAQSALAPNAASSATTINAFALNLALNATSVTSGAGVLGEDFFHGLAANRSDAIKGQLANGAVRSALLNPSADAGSYVRGILTSGSTGSSPSLATTSSVVKTALTGVNGAANAAVISSVIDGVKNLATLTDNQGANKQAFTNSVIGGLTDPAAISRVVQDVYNTPGLPVGTTAISFSKAAATSVKNNAIRTAAAISGGLALLSGSASQQLDLAQQGMTLSGTAVNVFAYNLALDATALTSGTDFLSALAANRSAAIKGQLAKGAVQSTSLQATAGDYVYSIVTSGTGIADASKAAFASAAISGAPLSSNFATVIAERISTTTSGSTGQINFAKSLAALQPALAKNIGIGVALTNPGLIDEITAKIVAANATTIKQAAAIAKGMADVTNLEMAHQIAFQIAASFKTSATLAAQAPAIALQLGLSIYGNPNLTLDDTSKDISAVRADQIAAAAYLLAKGLPPAATTTRSQILKIASNLATINPGTTNFSDSLAGQFYTAILTLIPFTTPANKTFLNSVKTALLKSAGTDPSTKAALTTAINNAIAAANNHQGVYNGGSLVTPETPVVDF